MHGRCCFTLSCDACPVCHVMSCHPHMSSRPTGCLCSVSAQPHSSPTSTSHLHPPLKKYGTITPNSSCKAMCRAMMRGNNSIASSNRSSGRRGRRCDSEQSRDSEAVVCASMRRRCSMTLHSQCADRHSGCAATHEHMHAVVPTRADMCMA